MNNKLTLKAARINRNLTQKQAAKLLKISKDTLGKWERGKSFPSVSKIPLLEEVYNIKYEDIIFLSKDYA